MNTLALGTVDEMTAKALFTVLMYIRVVQHMIRTDKLIIMCGKNDLAVVFGFLTPLDDFQNYGRRELIVVR